MKKLVVLISVILLIVIEAIVIKEYNNSNINENLNTGEKIYLQEIILEQIMFDYNYLTGNTEEVTIEYFNALKSGDLYSLETVKKLNIQNGSSFEIVMKIQNDYKKLIQKLSVDEKEDLDKYLLEQTLKFYYENSAANV